MRSRNLIVTLLLVWFLVFTAGAGIACYRTTVHRVKDETTVQKTVSEKASGRPETRGRESSPRDGRGGNPAESAP